MAIRNHWKKILLALFASIWAGCESTDDARAMYGTIAPCDSDDPECNGDYRDPMPEYGCGPCGCDGCEEEVTIDSLGKDSVPFVAPLYGVFAPEEPAENDSTILQPEEFDAPIAVYGPPCYFDGSCKLGEEEKK